MSSFHYDYLPLTRDPRAHFLISTFFGTTFGIIAWIVAHKTGNYRRSSDILRSFWIAFTVLTIPCIVYSLYCVTRGRPNTNRLVSYSASSKPVLLPTPIFNSKYDNIVRLTITILPLFVHLIAGIIFFIIPFIPFIDRLGSWYLATFAQIPALFFTIRLFMSELASSKVTSNDYLSNNNNNNNFDINPSSPSFSQQPQNDFQYTAQIDSDSHANNDQYDAPPPTYQSPYSSNTGSSSVYPYAAPPSPTSKSQSNSGVY